MILAAVVGRVHNAVSYPALRDWDADAHAVNVIAVLEGHLPNLRSWAGSHPPLYYAAGAALWALAPDWVPVHVLLRLISVVAWIGTIALVWRALRWLGLRSEADIVAALLLGIPGFVIASGMMTNDVLCVFFMTAALVRILEEPLDASASAARVVATALLAGLAAMTKATGLATIVTVAAF
ncbi:MAG: phospholipid carrier-dependent glycosyltransferase, partial [Candidatus Binatia bacterium]